jgi:CRP-like cAMP-binding protein
MIDEAMLDRVAVFRGASADARRELCARGVPVRYAAGQVLWRAGGEARGMVTVLRGTVRVVRASLGRERVVHVEGPGGTLGEVPLFAGGRYPATAIAAEATEGVVFTRDAVLAAVRADPALALLLLERMAARVRDLVDRLDRLGSRPVAARLAAHLLERQGDAGGAPFTLGGSQARVAEELGTVREVLVRALRRLREAGAIRSPSRGRFVVVDAAALERLASADGDG